MKRLAGSIPQIPRRKFFHAALTLMVLCYWSAAAPALGAALSPDLLKAKQHAEANGYVFVATKEEIIAKAKAEARLEALTFLEGDEKNAMIAAFRKKYPFVQVSTETIGGTDEYQRFILEMKAGRVKRWDTVHISNQVYNEYPPYLKKFDILGMAEQGVLRIPSQIVDSNHRNIVSKTTQVAVVAYNKKLISPEKLPTTWEGFLNPEFKDKKMVVDVRPLSVANLVPAWGLEKTLDFARKIAAQKPVWVRGNRTLVNMAMGEYAIFMGVNVQGVIEAQAKDATRNLEFQLLDPVPVRFGSADGVFGAASHPHAALLWLEFQVSAEGQRILDQYGPADGSVYVPGSVLHTLIRGRTLSFMSWNLQKNQDEWIKKITEAYGFPAADKGR
jgi:iron(III) transport system substrate-binding protein